MSHLNEQVITYQGGNSGDATIRQARTPYIHFLSRAMSCSMQHLLTHNVRRIHGVIMGRRLRGVFAGSGGHQARVARLVRTAPCQAPRTTVVSSRDWTQRDRGRRWRDFAWPTDLRSRAGDHRAQSRKLVLAAVYHQTSRFLASAGRTRSSYWSIRLLPLPRSTFAGWKRPSRLVQ